jgi:hypothetical protein
MRKLREVLCLRFELHLGYRRESIAPSSWGGKEIADSALLTGKFMEKNFVGDANNP